MTAAEPTEEQLRVAYASCWRDSPRRPTFEEAMRDHTLRKLLQARAAHIAAGSTPAAPTTTPYGHRPAPAPQPARCTAAPVFDRKRAAAGERDDD